MQLFLVALQGLVNAQSNPSPYFTNAPIYRQCNRTHHVLTDLVQNQISLTIIKHPLFERNFTISGSIQIIDGCTFIARDIVYEGTRPAYWFGALDNSNDGVLLSNETLPVSFEPMTTPFNLTQRRGSQVSFGLFNQFRLYETSTNELIATANYPASVILAPEIQKLANDSVIRFGTGKSGAVGDFGIVLPILASFFVLFN